MGQRAAPAPFLKKTYQLVDDPETDDVVTWNENGTTFVVRETADFSRDLLPTYFKHNNFSSFVRQLNTYGFRKIVPDKWEFANDNFKRGEKELLSRIQRRKIAISPPQDGKTTTTACDQLSPSNSGVDLGSTSTSSPDSKRANFADLSNENNRLKRDNEMLVSELSQTKKKCDELMNLLKYINVVPRVNENDENNDNDENENEGEDGMKLFGVWVKGNGKKRGRDVNIGSIGAERKEIKTSVIDAPWMKITSPRGETSSVYN